MVKIEVIFKIQRNNKINDAELYIVTSKASISMTSNL